MADPKVIIMTFFISFIVTILVHLICTGIFNSIPTTAFDSGLKLLQFLVPEAVM